MRNLVIISSTFFTHSVFGICSGSKLELAKTPSKLVRRRNIAGERYSCASYPPSLNQLEIKMAPSKLIIRFFFSKVEFKFKSANRFIRGKIVLSWTIDNQTRRYLLSLFSLGFILWSGACLILCSTTLWSKIRHPGWFTSRGTERECWEMTWRTTMILFQAWWQACTPRPPPSVWWTGPPRRTGAQDVQRGPTSSPPPPERPRPSGRSVKVKFDHLS